MGVHPIDPIHIVADYEAMTKKASKSADKKQPQKKKPQKAPRISKRNLWLQAYLNNNNSRTFLNKTEAARAAGYKASCDKHLADIGHENSRLLADKIANWLEESGLSENALKIKLLSLLEGEETKTVTLKGEINKEEMPDNVQILATGVVEKYTKEGEPYEERETLLGVNMEAKELQRKTLDMAFKHKGMYAPEKYDHNIQGNIKHTHEEALNRALEQKAKITAGPGEHSDG